MPDLRIGGISRYRLPLATQWASNGQRRARPLHVELLLLLLLQQCLILLQLSDLLKLLEMLLLQIMLLLFIQLLLLGLLLLA